MIFERLVVARNRMIRFYRHCDLVRDEGLGGAYRSGSFVACSEVYVLTFDLAMPMSSSGALW